MRFLIYAFLVAGFVLGTLSALLRRAQALALTALALATAATLLGGSTAEVGDVSGAPGYLGLDWFLLNVLVLALLFVPLERLFARLPEQPIFRPGWQTDLAHFAVSHLLVQVTVLLTLAPATLFFAWAARPGLQQAVQASRSSLQFVEIVVVADLAEYVVHRAFHRVPWLWRFHEIHHSAAGDGLAGLLAPAPGRHRGDARAVVRARSTCSASRRRRSTRTWCSCRSTRSSSTPTCASRFRPLEWLVVTPRFHHWHHARSAGGRRQELRDPPADHRPAVRDRAFPSGALARRLRAGRAADARGLGPPARGAVPFARRALSAARGVH